jgi:hypothetical protein
MNREDENDDLDLAVLLFCGRWNRFGEVSYLKGEEEIRAREALARVLLAGPVHPGLAAMLAVTFYPHDAGHLNMDDHKHEVGDCHAYLASGRKVEFKLRSKIRNVGDYRDDVVGGFIQGRIDKGIRIKRAKALAMAKFNLSEETVRRIWLRCTRVMKEIETVKRCNS